jgi:hypothetical protein
VRLTWLDVEPTVLLPDAIHAAAMSLCGPLKVTEAQIFKLT